MTRREARRLSSKLIAEQSALARAEARAGRLKMEAVKRRLEAETRAEAGIVRAAVRISAARGIDSRRGLNQYVDALNANDRAVARWRRVKGMR